MRETETQTRGPQVVSERWWHRLLRVLIYVSTFLVLSCSGLFLSFDPANYTHSYSYSFENDFKTFQGEEDTCLSYRQDELLSCGELRTPAELLARLTNARHSRGLGADRDFPEALVASAVELGELLDRGGIKYRHAEHWKLSELAKVVGLSLVISILWYLCFVLLYKVILFIVHGHTRVRRSEISS